MGVVPAPFLFRGLLLSSHVARIFNSTTAPSYVRTIQILRLPRPTHPLSLTYVAKADHTSNYAEAGFLAVDNAAQSILNSYSDD